MADPKNKPSSSSPAAAPMIIDGSDEDSALARSLILTRKEVLKRRSRRLKQLAKVYRDHYWDLMEELKIKHRQYYWEFGKSPFLQDQDKDEENPTGINGALGTGADANNNNIRNCDSTKLGLTLGVNPNRCAINGCKLKAMALTRFCHSHILSDSKQKLYKGCNYITKSTSAGPIYCMKPMLSASVPCLCPLHLQKLEKHVSRALKKAGLNVNSTSKLTPKFHVIVSEFVRRVQTSRRALQKRETGDKVLVTVKKN